MLRRFATPTLLIVALAAPAWAQVKLEFKHPKDAKATYKEQLKLEQVMTVNGMDIETASDRTVTSTYTNSEGGEGKVKQTRKIDALKAQIDLPGGLSATFDSAKPDANKPENPLLQRVQDAMKALVGLTYTVTFDKDGKVAAVETAPESIDKAEGIDDAVKAEMKKQFNSDRLEKELQEEYGIFPDMMVKKGEPWERTEVMNIGAGQSLTFKRKYEYVGTEQKDGKTLDKINAKTTDVLFKMEPNPAMPASVSKSDLKVDESDGTILFDREAGRIVSKAIKVRVKGDLTLDIQGNELPTKLDLTIDTQEGLEPATK